MWLLVVDMYVPAYTYQWNFVFEFWPTEITKETSFSDLTSFFFGMFIKIVKCMYVNSRKLPWCVSSGRWYIMCFVKCSKKWTATMRIFSIAKKKNPNNKVSTTTISFSCLRTWVKIKRVVLFRLSVSFDIWKSWRKHQRKDHSQHVGKFLVYWELLFHQGQIF